MPLPNAAEPPLKGAKVVFDITADAKPADLNKGLERVARLLNLYGSVGLKASDVKLALVLHGEATKSALVDDAYKQRFSISRNPNLALIAELRKAGVEVFVCGQAAAYKGFKESEVAEGVQVASAALTVIIQAGSRVFLRSCPLSWRPRGGLREPPLAIVDFAVRAGSAPASRRDLCSAIPSWLTGPSERPGLFDQLFLSSGSGSKVSPRTAALVAAEPAAEQEAA